MLIFALPLLLLGWLFWTQNKRMKQMRNFSSALNVGDQVITSSGIFGTIKHLDDSSGWLEIADGVTIRVDRRAIAMKQTDALAAGTGAAGGAAGGAVGGSGTATSGTVDPTSDAGSDHNPGSTPGSSQSGQ
ncbi:preprotein translocase subunit YajC [Humibacillus xanthopallidus]|uniref:preprotein translocase subunit YajC n=1 Tax=Humibacillus xanthopallidus TaxID=412689 RepID=UPI001FE739F0|nr:preprotein translocase subunit YajC [Humibacillus xanthopallidus]